VYQFVTWAGRGDSDETAEKITAISINRYICGLKAWHVFHGAQYPKDTEQRVKLLLKASGKQDSLIPKKPEKSPVQITDLAIVAFWGMARMAELTYAKAHGPILPKSGVTPRDLKRLERCTIVEIHNAKTAGPGEVQQLKLVQVKQNKLCPVLAIERPKY